MIPARAVLARAASGVLAVRDHGLGALKAAAAAVLVGPRREADNRSRLRSGAVRRASGA